jgi:hypothetical protein
MSAVAGLRKTNIAFLSFIRPSRIAAVQLSSSPPMIAA